MVTIDIVDNYFDHYKRIKYDDSNLADSIELFHTWYDSALELFSQYFKQENKFYDVFTSIDNSGNGFLLHNNFSKIRSAYIVLSNALKNNEQNKHQIISEKVFATGCVWDAWSFVSELIRSAKQRIVLIDNYIDDRVLSILSKRSIGVQATIHTRYNKQLQTDLAKHNEQYPEINFIQLGNKNHDRFLIIDDEVFLLGASLKDIGSSLCAIIKMHASPEIILNLLKKQCNSSLNSLDIK